MSSRFRPRKMSINHPLTNICFKTFITVFKIQNSFEVQKKPIFGFKTFSTGSGNSFLSAKVTTIQQLFKKTGYLRIASCQTGLPGASAPPPPAPPTDTTREFLSGRETELCWPSPEKVSLIVFEVDPPRAPRQDMIVYHLVVCANTSQLSCIFRSHVR